LITVLNILWYNPNNNSTPFLAPQVTPSARPPMGPNLYVTPPAPFTHSHQDGHGTVDSGHLCIGGYNGVVMLRRLTERHKEHALWILSGRRLDGHYYGGLYTEPHGDGLVRQVAQIVGFRLNHAHNVASMNFF